MISEQITSQAEERLNEYFIRSKMEVDKEAAKVMIRNESKMDLEWKKFELQDYKRQVRNACYTTISVDKTGVIELKEKNAIADIPSRPIANFTLIEIVNLESTDGEQGFYGLQLAVESTPKNIILNAQKIGKPEYFLNKITAVGGQIFVNSESKKKENARNLWVELCKQCKYTVIVPTNRGWICDRKKRYRFVEEGEVLWENIIRQAK